MEALFVSNINGMDFHKLTPELQELIDWEIIKIQNRLYFRTIEDIDRNGEFNKKDKIHYFFVDFNKEVFRTIEYNIVN